jgi:hypothetical protein
MIPNGPGCNAPPDDPDARRAEASRPYQATSATALPSTNPIHTPPGSARSSQAAPARQPGSALVIGVNPYLGSLGPYAGGVKVTEVCFPPEAGARDER